VANWLTVSVAVASLTVIFSGLAISLVALGCLPLHTRLQPFARCGLSGAAFAFAKRAAALQSYVVANLRAKYPRVARHLWHPGLENIGAAFNLGIAAGVHGPGGLVGGRHRPCPLRPTSPLVVVVVGIVLVGAYPGPPDATTPQSCCLLIVIGRTHGTLAFLL